VNAQMEAIAQVLEEHNGCEQIFYTFDLPYECWCGERVQDHNRHLLEKIEEALLCVEPKQMQWGVIEKPTMRTTLSMSSTISPVLNEESARRLVERSNHYIGVAKREAAGPWVREERIK
jgi:hypothetical protein